MGKVYFKRILSIMLSVALLLTVCVVAPLTAFAAIVSVTTNNCGTVSVVEATVGEELERPQGIEGLNFIGWYSDTACTTEFGTVQADETRTAYAKYDATLITFEQNTDYVADVNYRDGKTVSTSTSGVVVDPTDSDNHVFKLHSPDTYSNVVLPEYEAQGASAYTLVSNHSYTFTMTFMIPDTIPTTTFVVRWNKGIDPVGGAGRTSFGDKTCTTSEFTPGQWYTHSVTYNVGDTSTQTGIQAVFLVADTTYDTNYIYFDNIIIKDNDSGYAVSTDSTYTGFENATVTYSGGLNSSTSVTVSEEQVKAGTKALKIAPSGSSTNYRGYVYNGTESAIKLDSYTNYEGSFWYYAEAASDNTITLERVGGTVWIGNVSVFKYTVDSSQTGEWIKVDFKFNSGDCTKYKYLAFALYGSSGDVFYFDEFSVKSTGKEMVDFNCEFDADFSFYTVADGVTWPYYCSGSATNVLWTQSDGIVTFTTSHNGTPSTSGASLQYFSPYDGAGFCALESNSVYEIKIRYKQTAANTDATGRLSIGTKTGVTNWAEVYALVIESQVGTTDWIENTYSVTTGDLGTNTHLVISMSSSSGAIAYDLDYIKVTKGPFVNDCGELSKLTVSVGEEIPEPAARDGMSFLGWYSDINCTVPYGRVQENETRNAYAGYNKTLITFGEVQLTSGGNYRDDASTYNTFTSGIVQEPDDADNKVFELHNPGIWANILVPVYDAKGALAYQLVDGNEYTVSVKYMIPETATATHITLRCLGGTGSTGGSRSVYSATAQQLTVSDLEKGKWYTYEKTFTASDTSAKPYLLFSFLMDDDNNTNNDIANPGQFGVNNFLYIDDIQVFNASSFVDVTLNDRGYVYTETMVIGQQWSALSSIDEASFVGWYSDPECTVSFGAVQENDSRIAYAKYDTVKISFNDKTAVFGLTKVTSGYALMFNATATEQQFNLPCYDAADASNLKVEANKTYAVRFIYKLGAGSDSGYISVLGNKFNFAATETGTDGWAVGAVCFTTAVEGDLTFNVASISTAQVYVDEFTVYEVTGTPETSVTVGLSTISATELTASGNMLTGKVNVALESEEQLAVKGLTVTYDLYATAFSEQITTKAFISTGSYDLDRDDTAGDGSEFVYSVPANAKNIKISAEFTSTDTTNMGIIASSTREPSATQSAGIRFRGRVYNKDGITKVGFLLAPKSMIEAAGYTTLTLDNYEVCQALNVEATGIVYDQTDTYTDYQVLLTGINSMTALDIMTVLYVQYSDTSVEYSASATQSYDKFTETANKIYRGITSYYYDEFEDTRDKLISKSEDGSFSAIMLTDTHIDYSFNAADSDISEFYQSSTYYERYLIEREMQAVIELANTSDVDCIVLGGDLVHGTKGRASALADLQHIVDMFKKAKVPTYVLKGNHDNNDYHGTPCALEYIISTDTWTEEILKPLAKNTEIHDESNAKSAYYYVDFPEKNTRLIVLSPYSYPITSSDGVYSDYTAQTWNRVDDTQLKWFAKVALDAEKQDWNYVLSVHGPITGTESVGSSSEICAIVNAFNNKTSVDVAGTTVDYSNVGSYIPYSIGGHTHISSYRHMEDSMHIAINTGSARLANYPDNDYSPLENCTYYQNDRYEYEISEALFDVLISNFDASVIERISFGANSDNTFTAGEGRYTATENN